MTVSNVMIVSTIPIWSVMSHVDVVSQLCPLAPVNTIVHVSLYVTDQCYNNICNLANTQH